MALLIQFKENPLKKGSWSVEEDNKLVAYIRNHGIWNWNEMPKAAGLARTGKSCRLRWMNYLRPNLKHGNFTKEEDETILKLHKRHGNRWATIASKLPGRSDNEIKNHFHTRLRKIAEKRKAKLLHRSSSSGQASSPLESDQTDYSVSEQNPSATSSTTPPTSLSYSSEPSPTSFSSSSSDNYSISFGTYHQETTSSCEFTAEEEKVTGYYYGNVDQLQLSVERLCMPEESDGIIISDYESYWLEEYCFNLQDGANTVLDDGVDDDTDHYFWFDIFNHGID